MANGNPPSNAQKFLLLVACALGIYYLWSPGRTTLGVFVVGAVGAISARVISGKQVHVDSFKTGGFWYAVAEALGLIVLAIAWVVGGARAEALGWIPDNYAVAAAIFLPAIGLLLAGTLTAQHAVRRALNGDFTRSGQ